MKTNLRKALFVAAAAMMGVSAWADGISPAADYSYRLNWNTNKSEMNFTYKTNHGTDTQTSYEIKWTTQLFALQQYNIENFKYAKTLTLNIAKTTTGNTTSMAVWDFGTNTLPTTGTTADSRIEFLKKVQGITGTWFYQTETPSSENYAATTATAWGNTALATAAYKSESSAFVATIDVSKLTNVTMDGTTGKVRFLITTNTPNAGTAAKYDAGSTLTVTNWAVYNETTSTGYDNLASAVSAANENDVIKLLSDQTLTARLDITKAITIDGNDKTITTTYTGGSSFLVSAAATVKNCAVDAADGEKAVFEFANSTTAFSANIEGVTVKDGKVGGNGVYRIKDKATVTLKNITISDIDVTEDKGEIAVCSAAAACKLTGTNTVASVYLEKGKRLDVNGATINSPIQLSFVSDYADSYVCVQNCGDVTKFTLYDTTKELYKSSTKDELLIRTKVTEVTANMEITAAGCATFCAPFNVEIPAGVKAYTADAVVADSWISMTEITTGTIVAGTPVVLYSNAALASTEFKGTPDATEAKGAVLTGNIGTEKTEVANGSYLLQTNNGVTGWYQVNVTGEDKLYIGVNRCYMKKQSGAKPCYLMGFDGVAPTAINNVAAEAKTKADGKYFVNGQIVIVKAGKAFNAAGAQVK